jgi:single-stranded-DNA-specific exonuclease
MRSRYRWECAEADERLAAELAASFGLPKLLARLLAARGWTREEDVRRMLDDEGGSFHDPFQMKGMAEAAERILKAVRDGERIRVFGDYDADGVTSTALMSRLLGRLGASFDTYIPHRSREGYGLSEAAVDDAAAAGASLIVTVDNGISAVGPIAYAREKGVDVVVTDHHEPPPRLPEALALVNPKQADCPYPFKGLSGAGVAFKLAHALLGEPDLALTELACIGTVADLMPLLDENRAIVRHGLERMRRSPSPGVRALAAVSGFKPSEMTSGRIAFFLAPRLNAGGRLESADGAAALLLSTNDDEADRQAEQLDLLNRERQLQVERTVEEAEALLRKRMEDAGTTDPPNVIVLAGDGWNAGIAGLVASKLVERYYRPAVVLARDPDTGKCKGSARSIEGFDLYAALSACAELMDHFGGHQAAAGLTIDSERVKELEQALGRLAAEWLLPEDWIPKKKADLVGTIAEMTPDAVSQLERLEPFGQGNPVPRFVIRGATVAEGRAIGKQNRHLRLLLEQGGRRLEAVGFGFGSDADRLPPGAVVDVLGELTVNEWNGSRRVQMTIRDWRYAGVQIADRRSDRTNIRHRLEALAAGGERCLIIGTAPAMNAVREWFRDREQTADFLYTYGTYGELPPWTGGGESPDSGAARAETASAAQSDAHAAAGWNRLILCGLPETSEQCERLKKWLSGASCADWIEVWSWAEDRVSEGMPESGKRHPFPSREHFAEVYSLFRKQGEWTDGPDGFLRSVSERTGWPLASIRMMREVFEELGFLKVDRAKVTIVPSPAKRDLEQSVRYRRAREKAGEFPDWSRMTTADLRSWLLSCIAVRS